MSKGKKYSYQVAQEDNGWTAGIIRRVSAHRTMVSKTQGGFETEALAQEWAESELKAFREGLTARNKRRDDQREIQRAEQRKADEAKAAWLAAKADRADAQDANDDYANDD